MKKRRRTPAILPALALALCLCVAGGGAFRLSARADAEYKPTNGYTTTNVAAGKTAKFTYIDGTEIPHENVRHLHGQEGFNPYEALTDGDLEAGEGHNLVTLFNDAGEKTQGYAVIDLGKAYTITSVGVLFWVNHRQLNVLVQVANSEDFSDAVTLYNSDEGNALGQGIGYDEALKDVEKKLNIIERAPVFGRYVRVTGKSEQRKCSDFNEVAVYAVTDGLAPVAGNLITEKQSQKGELTLTTEHDGATIRYTTDGSIPTEESAEYTAPIKLSQLGANKLLVRASAFLTDGTATIPSDFKFDINEAARNVALGVMPTFDDDVQLATFNGSAAMSDDILKQVTDGQRGLENVAGTAYGFPAWLYLDFGAEYEIDTVIAEFWNDWEFAVLIQLSTVADFSSDVYTVYCNHTNVLQSYISVDGITETPGEDWYTQMREHNFEAVQARYLRTFSVSCRNANRFSAWVEIQAYNKANVVEGEEYPTPERAITKAKGIADVTVPNGSEKADFAEKLPAQVEVEDYLGNAATLTGEWNCTTFSGTTAGKYEFTFDAGETAWADIYGIMKINVTVAEAADKTALGALIEKAEALTESDYLPDTWAPLPDALSEAKTVFGGTKQFQAEIDKAQKALDEAVKGLLRKGDKTDLNAAIDEANKLAESEYSAASWSALAEKLAGATEVKENENATQSAVDNALAELNAAISALKKIGNTTELAARYNELKNTENKYTIATWTPFADALADAKAIVDSAEAYEDEIAKALAALNQTFAALEEKSDMSALEAAIAKAEQVDLSLYTQATAEALSASLEAAKAVSDDSEAEVIASAAADLEEKLAALVAIGNKTELNEYVSSCNYAADRYTVTTYNVYEAALEKAEAVRLNADAVQSEIDKALSELKAAVEALKELANKTALYAAIEEAEKIEKGGYSSESYDAFVKALEYARSVANSNDVSQADADGAIETLNSAKNALSAKKSGCGCGSNAVGVSSVVAAVVVLAVAVIMAKRKGKKENVK